MILIGRGLDLRSRRSGGRGSAAEAEGGGSCGKDEEKERVSRTVWSRLSCAVLKVRSASGGKPGGESGRDKIKRAQNTIFPVTIA